MNRKLQGCVRFARFATEHRIPPPALAELLRLAQAAFRAGERECNVPDSPADRQRERFEQAARAAGFRTQWDGLWPTLYRKGREVMLPSV